jgi:DNA polymerase III epsilon subunit-like protein
MNPELKASIPSAESQQWSDRGALSPVTNRRHRIMIFDVETSGLLPKTRQGVALTDLPHILQITFVIFDTQYWRTVKSVDLYIKIAENVEISPLITDLTGITREMCDQGVPIEKAMHEFYQEYVQCDVFVAHNIQFDREMVRVEMERCIDKGNAQSDYSQVFNEDVMKQQQKSTFCTMRVGRNLCKIERMGKNGVYFKSPKLVELYEHLFGMTPLGLHSSLVDTYVCLRCFVKIRYKFDLRMTAFPRMSFAPIASPSPLPLDPLPSNTLPLDRNSI